MTFAVRGHEDRTFTERAMEESRVLRSVGHQKKKGLAAHRFYSQPSSIRAIGDGRLVLSIDSLVCLGLPIVVEHMFFYVWSVGPPRYVPWGITAVQERKLSSGPRVPLVGSRLIPRSAQSRTKPSITSSSAQRHQIVPLTIIWEGRTSL